MYTITDWKGKKIVVKEHTRIVPYTKGASWHARLKSWVWSWLRMPVIYSLMAIIFMSSVTAAFFYGELYDQANHPQDMTPVAHAEDPLDADLRRIEFAESRGNQFCTNDAISHGFCSKSQKGLVLEKINKNGSIDIGISQINDKTWGAKAVALGFDLYTQQGNEDMARYILTKNGSTPWYSSAKTWK